MHDMRLKFGAWDLNLSLLLAYLHKEGWWGDRMKDEMEVCCRLGF